MANYNNHCNKLSLTIIIFIFAFTGNCYAQFDASRATRESDIFGRETEKKVERELKKAPQKVAPPKVEEEQPKEGEQKFFVKNIVLQGCESFPPEDFNPVIKKYENREVTFTELNNMTREIAGEYLRRGVIAAVFLPPQEVEDQTVVAQVVEARMGKLDVQKAPFYRKEMLQHYWTIKSGEILRYDKMYKSLQIMNKNPDREVRSALHAGEQPRTTDVILTQKTNFPIHGQYTFDREGIMTTGKERNGFGIRDNNTLGYDDSLFPGISFGKNFRGTYIYHSLPISNQGTSLMYGYSYSISTPRKDFDVYALKSISESTSFSVHQDIYKKEDYLGEIYGGFTANDKTTLYESGVGTLSRDRWRVINIGGSYTVRKEDSATSISPELDQGINGFGSSKANNILSSRSGASPTYTKFLVDVQNRTSLPFNLQQSLRFRTQLASNKLFSQEQYGLGGIDTVRGYPPSDYLADKMLLLNAEMLSSIFFLPKNWKFPYAEKPIKDQVTAVTFFDYGYGEQKGNPKPFRLSSVGVGLRMSFYNQVLLRLEWGFPLKLFGMDSLSEGMAPARFHISLNIEDKLPEEIERILKEMEEEKIKNEAWALLDEEMAIPGSPIKAKIDDYFYLADNLYKQDRLKEAREIYAMIANISKTIYAEAEKYVIECKIHEDELIKKSDEAMVAYKNGRLSDAKKLWEEVKKDSKPRSLVLDY